MDRSMKRTISFVFLISIFFGVNLTCGERYQCNLTAHIKRHPHTHWRLGDDKDYKGNPVFPPTKPLPYFNFHVDTEAEINKQINRELFAHYTYLSMTMHFNRDDINLPGFHKFFKDASDEHLDQAKKLMEYQNKRGGRVKLHNIMKPCEDQWGSGLDAMEKALTLEKEVYQALLDLHSVASTNYDPQLRDFLETNYLEEQVDSIKELSNYVNTLKRMPAAHYSLGEYQFDKITLGGGDSKTA